MGSLRACGVMLATAVVVAGCSQAVTGTGQTAVPGSLPTSESSSGASPTASFGSCDDVLNTSALPNTPGVEFSCATIGVPLNYSDPSGKSISLVLLRVHSDDNDNSKGSMLVNPGGPGGSGVQLAAGLAGELSGTLLKNFDMIGFDPRGVGLSSPIKCLSDAEKDTLTATDVDIRTTAGFTAAKGYATTLANACNSRYGADLAQYNTVNTARDMDRIRVAVGDDKMTYLGFSYGTELGAQYVHLFPNNLRAIVLDGAVDPLTDPVTSFANQLKGFESAFDQYSAACTDSTCQALGNLRGVVGNLVAQGNGSSPLTVTQNGKQRKATGGLILTGVLSALYSRSSWNSLTDGLRDAKSGDPQGLIDLADQYNQRYSDGTYSNLYESNATINCNDSPPGPTDDLIRSTATKWATAYPMFGVWAAQSLFQCQPWQSTRTVVPKPTAPSSSVKVLVVGNLHDPATPYQGTIDLAKTLGNAEVLSWDGEGHTSYLEGSSCIDDKVNAYLTDGTLPAANTTCPS